MPDIHLKFGGSTAHRTLNCPAWANLADKVPKINRSSPAAERGTMLHDIMETLYTNFEVSLDDLVKDLSQDDADAVRIAFTATEALLDKYGCDQIVTEELVQITEDIGGSADMLACSEEVALVIDYKFGFVPVTNTDQFSLYALCATVTPSVQNMFEGRRVISAIIQPEVSHSAIEHEHTDAELQKFETDFLACVELANTGAEDGNPGEWCKYCPAAASTCEAKQKQSAAFLRMETADEQELNQAVRILGDMKEQIKAVEREMMYRLEAGLPITGFKLVEKQARRHWIDPDEAMATLKRSRLRAEVYLEPDKLRSPAQIEKSIKAAGKKYDPSEMITKSSSGNTFAAASDKRPAIIVQVEVPDALNAVLNGE